jgi:hypothetical protein
MAYILYTAPNSGIQAAVEFDVTLDESPSFTATPTEHPVERGVPITDHVRVGLTRLSLQGMITNTPINEVTAGLSPGPLLGNPKTPFSITGYDRKQSKVAVVRGGQIPPASLRINGLPRPHTPITVEPSEYRSTPHQYGGVSLQFPERIDRVRKVFDVLSTLLAEGIELYVSTGLREYPQMLMTSLSAPRTIQDAVTFSMEFVEFRRAEVRTVAVRKRARVAVKRAMPPVAEGPKPKGWELEPSEGSDLQSVASRLQDQAAGISDRNYGTPGDQ